MSGAQLRIASLEAPSSIDVTQRAAERDRTLEALQLGRRREVIALAHSVAVELARAAVDGVVTAPLVHAEMLRRGLLTAEERAETRFLGAVFPGGYRHAARWKRVGYCNAGSKGRPVAQWMAR